MTKYDIGCLNKAKDLIDKDLARHYHIADMASLIGFSESKLKTGFKKLFGKGLYKYRYGQRMEKAKYLLENTEKTLKEISRLLGYRYKENFSTSYKKYFGKPPAEWRDENEKA